MNIYPRLLFTAMVFSLTACGGGGSDNGSDTNNSTATGTGAVTDAGTVSGNQDPAVLTGRLVDSAVIGMQYETATQSGVTGADGSFTYRANETVTFSLGDIVLPPVSGAPVVTPLDVFTTTNIGDTRVINLTRLLQTLDMDGDADNGITISESASASATGLSVDFASANFDSQVINLVANSGSVSSSLIDGESALDHFQETLFDEGIVERPQAPDNTQTGTTTNSNNTATHPRVGATAEFSNFAHGIAGTLTILDDRTFEVTNFFYDGGGPSVYFYLGTGGDYSSRGVGIQVGPLLNGRVYAGDTVRVTLPDGITLDDFDGVSVWCDLFFANFGDARL